MTPDQQVLQHGRVFKQLYVLKGSGDAELRYLLGFHAGDVMTVEMQRAATGLIKAADQIKDRRFAGAVGPDDGKHLTGLDRKTDIVNSDNAAKAD